MGAWHMLMVGISRDFGAGLVVGAAIAFGMIFLLSRTARNLR